MEPFTTIILSAAAAFGSTALGKVAELSIADAWEGLKKVLVKRFGSNHEAPKLLDQLRAAPKGPEAERAAAALAAMKVDQDPEVAQALKALADAVKGGSVMQHATAGKVIGSQFNSGTINITLTDSD